MNLPNLITVVRILSVPVVVYLIVSDALVWAFWLFVAAGLSDAVDGSLARRWNQRTELGAYLDALADKVLLVSIYVALAVTGAMPAWLVIAVVSRDFMIVAAVVLSRLLDRPVSIAPLWVSKANTAMQIVFAALVLGGTGYGLRLGWLPAAAEWAVAALTLASLAAYFALWMRHMAAAQPAP